MPKLKKRVKVRDQQPSKDAKGGSGHGAAQRHHGGRRVIQGGGSTTQGGGGAAQGGGISQG